MKIYQNLRGQNAKQFTKHKSKEAFSQIQSACGVWELYKLIKDTISARISKYSPIGATYKKKSFYFDALLENRQTTYIA